MTKTTFKVGDKVRVVNGRGFVADGTVTEVDQLDTALNGESAVYLKALNTAGNRTWLRTQYIEKVAEQVAKFKVGDKVRATKASNGYYGITTEQNGWTGVITSIDDDGEFAAETITPKGECAYSDLDPKYFELIETKPTKNQRITTLEQMVADLQAEVEALKATQNPTISIDGGTLVISKETDVSDIASKLAESIAKMTERSPRKKMSLTPNEQRKAIIAEAKAFVEDAKNFTGNCTGRLGYKYEATNNIVCDVEFIVNPEKRTVVALLRKQVSEIVAAKAIAKCAPDDVFNADIGKAIALGRALGLDVSKFEQAVKPTEVVNYMKIVSDEGVLHTVTPGDHYEETHGTRECQADSPCALEGIITDDTEAKY